MRTALNPARQDDTCFTYPKQSNVARIDLSVDFPVWFTRPQTITYPNNKQLIAT